MDNIYQIQAVNPELAKLMFRLKSIYAICGGEAPSGPNAGKKADFAVKKSVLLSRFHEFDKLCDARDSSGLSKDSRDRIRMDVTVRMELDKLEEAVKDLSITHKKEVEKAGAKMSPEERENRKEIMASVVRGYQEAYKHAKGYAHRSADENLQSGIGINSLTAEQLTRGDFAGAGVKTRREELSGEHVQMLSEISAQTQEQDAILEELSKGLDELKQQADNINDELVAQSQILDDLDGKTDKVQAKLDRTNDRMKEALKLVNDKSSNCCIYIICICILLGIASVALKLSGKV